MPQRRTLTSSAPAATTAAAVAVVVFAIVLWLGWGVPARDAAAFLAFEAVFVLAPGWLAYGTLDAAASSARRLAFGWALGYVLLIAAFVLTAAAGHRDWLWAYPPLVAAGVLAARWRGRRPARAARERSSSARSVAAAAVVAVTLALVAASAFPGTPLPGSVPAVTYAHDVVFAVALAGDALHHWPPGDPHVAGLPFRYHWFAYVHIAAAAQVAHVPLSTLVMRLAALPLVALFVLLAIEAGVALGGSLAAGVGAAAIPLFATELDLDPHALWPFNGYFFTSIWSSPSLVLGLVLFVPALVLVAGRLGRPLRDQPGQWVLIALFLAGCAGAKSPTLPVLGGGLVLMLAWRALRGHGLEQAAAASLGLAAALYGLFWLFLYRGGVDDVAPTFRALGSVRTMSAITFYNDARSGAPRALLLAVGAVIGSAGLLCGVLAGLGWFVRRDRIRSWHVLFFAVFLASLVPFYSLIEPGASEVFFLEFGLVAVGIVSAEGIARLLARRDHAVGLGAYAVVWTGVLLVAAFLPLHGWRLAGRDQTLLRYGLFTAVVLALALLALATAGARRNLAVRALVVTILAAAALNVPLDLTVPHGYQRAGSGLTPGLLHGLDWVRTHTPATAVLAANNYWADSRTRLPDDFYYSAFSERRVFLEGWVTSLAWWRMDPAAAARGEAAYPERLSLNEAVFQRADRHALATLVNRYGVRYLVVDHVHRSASPRVARLGRRVFDNRDVTVYAVGSAA